MNKWLLFLVLVATPSFAGNLISSATWTEDGGFKMAQQDQYPLGFSSSTISRIWDGTTIKLFGGKGELLTWVTYLNAGASNATNVMVKISSFTGTGSAAGSGFASVVVSSMNVWDYTQRPYSLYKYAYLQQIGFHNASDAAWDPSEYEARQVAPRWRRPFTVGVNNNGAPNGGTTFLSRPDANKFYPDPAVPMEEFGISSFTVAASSSQAIGGEVYISTGLPAGTYTSALTVYEGATVSTTIPIQLLVYNVTLPATPSYLTFGDIGYADLDIRLTGTRFPANENVDPYLTNHLRVAAFLHRHKLQQAGMPNVAGIDYPDTEWAKHIDGTAYTETYGTAWNTGPGYGVGDKFLMIGIYGSWHTASWSDTVTGGASGYCTNVSSWTAYCQANGLNCQLYTADDEAVPAILAARVNRLSTWSSTAPACAFSGHTLPFFQTGSLPTVITSAPYVSTIVSTSWLGVSSNTWVADEAISTYTIGAYNANVGVDSILENQEAGIGPREPIWGDYKTKQKMHFLWETNYWNDSNNGGQLQNGYNANSNNDNDLFKNSKTFGYDLYPTTDAVKGHTGFNFGSDGVLVYPSSDTVYGDSYSFNGVIGSWKLNMLTRGIQDADLLNQAFAINPSSTTDIVNNLVSDVMYLRGCFTLADCTYVYGDRPWQESANAYEVAREALEQTIANANQPPIATPPVMLNGTITIKGKVSIQ